jgi:uncharacterized protein YndB with AHSA1/START domain
VNAIAGHFDMSRSAVSQHLRILLEAGLVTEQRYGRERRYRLVPERLGPVRDWIALRALLGRPPAAPSGPYGEKERVMTKIIKKEIVIARSPDDVWRALTDRSALAEWMYPNDFEPRVGHRFTFQVPPNPKAGFDGIVRGEVLECTPLSRLTYSWSGGPVVNTQVSYRLEPDGGGTRIFFEHSGFDVSEPQGEQALKGAEFGWTKMLERLSAVALEGIGER